MKKLVAGTRAGVVALALAATLAAAAPASAAETPRNQGAACVQAGLGTLKNLGLVPGRRPEAARLQHPGQPDHGPHLHHPAGGELSVAGSSRWVKW